MTLAVGAKGLDSGDKIDPKDAHSHGVRFMMRYSAGEGNDSPKSQWKLTGESEIKHILDAGILFRANSEWYEDRVTEGKDAGKADGAKDLKFWESRGLPKGASIFPSWDKDPSTIHYPAVERYIDGYRSELDGHYVLDGMYAGLRALNFFAKHHGIKHAWIPSAASWTASNYDIPNHLAPPANSFWDLWQPTDDQVAPAIKFFQDHYDLSHFESVVWQCGNYMYNRTADVNYLVKGGNAGFVVPAGTKEETKPAPKPVSHPHPSPTPKPEPSHQPQHAKSDLYTVKKGDTLVSIAKKHNTTWQKIFKANKHRISNPNRINPGDEIHIP